MGADLYLKSAHDVNKAKWQPIFDVAVAVRNSLPETATEAEREAAQGKVSEAYDGMNAPDGYFRDPYNPTGFASLMGYSWWQDVVPLQDDEGNLSGDHLKTFRAMVDKPITDAMLTEKQQELTSNTVEELRAYYKEELRAYYEKDKANLLALIDKAISLGEPIYASL